MSNQFRYKLILLQHVFIVPVLRSQLPKDFDALKLQYSILGNYKQKYGYVYNPTYGYEPYWEDGDWVFTVKELPPGVTTTSVPLVCGEECSYLYTGIGKVCGRKADHLGVDGCHKGWIYGCDGDTMDDQTQGYRTFDTYCKFLDAQCREEFRSSWIFVHEGPCVVPQDLLFKPVRNYYEPVQRMKKYFTALVEVFQNKTLPPLDI
ncbi:uncharacterized protein LOC124538650 [Vanessa cardui]|uniref:uncharacterized protein LOC124538650 n=1 Tax=Vanessa cardui TaxID=171605 RepID=UPI001F13FCF5|nr:uncharacterized protein LOC124538650 [Vanessa cardui]